MHRKRFAWSGVALALSAMLFVTACSGKSGGSSPEASPSASVSPSASASPIEPAKPEEPISLHILNSHAGAKYAQQFKPDDPYVKELNRLSGYDIKWEFLGHNEDFVNQLTLRFASNELADLVRTTDINANMHPGAVDNGVFTDLTDLIEQYGPNLKKNIPEQAWASPKVSKNGKIYGIPNLNPLPGARIMYIRQDWLDKLGMKQPSTIEEWVAYFEAVKKEDMNGNGDPNDEYGFYVRTGMRFSDVFFKEFGFHPTEWTYRDGMLQPGMIQPEMKEALKFWKSLYENKYVNPDFFTAKVEDWGNGIHSGYAGSWSYDYTAYNVSYPKEKFVNQPDVKLEMLPGPVGPGGKHGLQERNDQIVFAWVIPTSSKKAIEAIKFLDWAWSSPEAQKFFNYGIKDLNYTESNGKISWDKNSEANKANDNLAWVFYQYSLNPILLGTVSPKLLELQDNQDKLQAARKASEAEIYDHDSMFMPAIKAFQTKPELVPGFGNGTLFMDMFAKVLTGKEPVDQAFDSFVSEWKSRGGEEGVKEATDWYKAFHKK